jgi:aspartate aminotransferase
MKPLSLTRAGLGGGAAPGPPSDDLLDLASDYTQFSVPGPVAEAIAWAARQTDLGRHNTAGGHYLCQAVAAKLLDVNDLEVGEDSIVLTGGGGVALTYALGAVCDPGDQVLVPDPGWTGYGRLAASWGAQPVPYAVGLDGVPDYDDLEDLIEPQTKVLLVNQPLNPTGAALDDIAQHALVDFAREHDLYLLCDEQSDMLRLDGAQPVSLARFDTDGRVVTVYSFARTHAMAGLRLGYLVAAPPLARAVAAAQESQMAGPSTLALAAGHAALTMDRSSIDSMIEAYRLHRDIVAANLPAAVLPYHPVGGYFMVVDVSACGYPDAAAFAAELHRAQNLRVAPGTLFGQQAAQLVRLTLAVRERILGQALERLANFMGVVQ